MKKTYIKPEVAVMEIEMESLLAGSPNFDSDNGKGSMDLISAPASSEAMSTGPSFNIWGGDEE